MNQTPSAPLVPSLESKNETALITGGTRGIGRAICLALAAQGYSVAFTYRTGQIEAASLLQELAGLCPAGRHSSYAVDMADAVALRATLEKILEENAFPTVFVSNAGINIDGLALRYKTEDWDRTFHTNTRAAFLGAQAVLRPMMKARKGSIIFISSVIGQTGNAGQTAYAASKAALIGMAKSLAKEVGSRGVRVNVVAPGFIDTKMTESLPEATKQSILGQTALNTFGTPEDIAHAVTFLAGPGASYITGQVLGVNGGLFV